MAVPFESPNKRPARQTLDCAEVGRGGFADVSLAEAREQARRCRQQVRAGVDPLEARDEAKREREAKAHATRTFDQVWPLTWPTKSTRNGKAPSIRNSTALFEVYCSPIIGTMAIAAVTTDDVLRVLRQKVKGDTARELWFAMPVVGERLRGRIENVLAYAMPRGWRTGENPARWHGHLDAILPRPGRGSRRFRTSCRPAVRRNARIHARAASRSRARQLLRSS